MIQPVGYFKLWRELMTNPIWLNSTPEQKTILITLLSMANFKPKQWEWKGNKFIVVEGQFITSAKSIIECCGNGITRQNVRTSLERFRKLEFLTYESTKTGMLITIGNWALYQGNGDGTNQDTNQQLTNDQPRPNQDLTTREESKNVKNEKKEDIYTEIHSLFNSICISLPKVQALSKSRKDKIKVRWDELKDIEKFREIFEKVESCKFLKGDNVKNWKASFDWLMENDRNYLRVLEGQYDNKAYDRTADW